jgi:hypothetical protein
MGREVIVRRTIPRKQDWEGPGMNTRRDNEGARKSAGDDGLAPWLICRLFNALVAPLRNRLGKRERIQPRLALLERIALAPRQSLALVEAEGRRFLIATSTEGGPAFYALDSPDRPLRSRSPRVSW